VAAAALVPTKDGVETGFTGGGAVGVTIRANGPLIRKPGLELLLGMGYTSGDEGGDGNTERVDVPLALGFSLVLPVPRCGGFNAKPWIAPRVHFRWREGGRAALPSAAKFGFGFSGGLTVTSRKNPGVGLHFSADWLIISDRYPLDSRHEVVIEVGVHLRTF
jgi:hypothetical protein